MKEYNLKKLIENGALLNGQIQEFLSKKVLLEQKEDVNEVQGHLLKAEHNLRFVQDNIRLGYLDWSITGCYYACYHAALALIMTKGYFSKNHLATLCILIKECYEKELTKEDIEMVSNLLDYQDVLFYVESKNKREDATYSTRIKFERPDVEKIKINSNLFVAKVKKILEDKL